MGYFDISIESEAVCFISLQKECDNSSYIFSKIIMFFKENGYKIVPDINCAKVLVINTCAISDQTIVQEEKALQKLIKKHNNKNFIIFGCLAKLSNKFDNVKNVLLVKPKETSVLDERFSKSKSINKIDSHYMIGFSNYQPNLTDRDYFIRICQGCVNNCSYCNIKIAKGYVISKAINKIAKEVRDATKKGIFSVTLLADDCGSYGIDIKTNIANLIDKLLKINENLTLKIYSINPCFLIKYYSLLRKFIKDKRISYICLPCQSGSQRILDLMNRKYDINQVKTIVKEIKEICPSTHLCTHILYNFPTESKEDFKKSLDLAKEFDFNIFLKFGENKETPSARISSKCSYGAERYKEGMINSYIKNQIVRGDFTSFKKTS